MYEEVPDNVAQHDNYPVYEEIGSRDKSATDRMLGASTGLFTPEYAEITMKKEAKTANEYELTQCVAYGLPMTK